MASVIFIFRSFVWFEVFLYRRFPNVVSLCPFDFSFTVRLISNSFLFDCSFLSLELFSLSCRLHLFVCGVLHYCFCGCGQYLSGAVRRLHHFQCLSVESLCIGFIFAVAYFLNVLFAVLVYFDVLPFADVQFACGSCRHFFQVRAVYPGADSLHAEFITCTSNEVYCDANHFMFLVNEP